MSQEPKAIYLKDYKVPAYLFESTDLRFELFEDEALVHAELVITRNPACTASAPALELHGHESVELVSLSLDGRALTDNDYVREGEMLTIATPPERFCLTSTTRIHPESNTALEGLYKSGGMFCTQCEAEGFRRITFFPDRPDVMSVFRTTVEADKTRYPELLSNGNPVARGLADNNRHWVTWEDPFPKPAYLLR